MCGIVGFVRKKHFEIDDLTVIEAMTNSLIHRGPNDSGTKLIKNDNLELNIAIGHRRLSIIDLSSNAHQPMNDENENFFIVFNGEIYNYIELKNELINIGHIFKSDSDTEVVLKAYEEWGMQCFKRFNGMWSLAIYDKKKECMVLSRDRFGKKPLFYYKTSEIFIFASEIKAILKFPDIDKKPNYKKVFRYISGSYRYVDCDNESFFRDIYHIPKSSYVIISGNMQINNYMYWDLLENTSKNFISENDAIDSFRELLIDSVRLRLRSDVPVGCMLSGGMDSTSITSIAYKILNTQIITFSGITGDQKGIYDESEYIDEVVRETKAEHHYIKPEPSDLFTTLTEMLSFHDEPVCTVTWYALYLIAKKIKDEGVPVVLNGHGGDELLAGYWYHYPEFFYDLEKDGEFSCFNSEISQWQQNHGRNISEFTKAKEFIKSFYFDGKQENSKYQDYSFCFSLDFIKTFKNEKSFLTPYDKKSYLSRVLYNELMHETVPASLRAEDRNTMANSIESRSPMLDYRLTEFCFSLPNNFKIRDGIGKWILRESMKGILPEKVRTRKDKAGFLSPADRWFRNENREQIRELINSEDVKLMDIFDIEQLNSIFNEHLLGGKNHQMFLWQFINFVLWYRKFFSKG